MGLSGTWGLLALLQCKCLRAAVLRVVLYLNPHMCLPEREYCFVNMLTEHNQEIAGTLPDTLVGRHTQSEDLGTRLSLVSRLSLARDVDV